MRFGAGGGIGLVVDDDAVEGTPGSAEILFFTDVGSLVSSVLAFFGSVFTVVSVGRFGGGGGGPSGSFGSNFTVVPVLPDASLIKCLGGGFTFAQSGGCFVFFTGSSLDDVGRGGGSGLCFGCIC